MIAVNINRLLVGEGSPWTNIVFYIIFRRRFAGRLSEIGSGHGRSVGDEFEKTQMVSEVFAQRSAVPAVPRFRRRAQLFADVHEKYAGPVTETRTKRLLVLSVGRRSFVGISRDKQATDWWLLCFRAHFLGHWNYTHTIRRPRVRGQVIEVKTQLSHRDYVNLLSQKDETHHPIYKKRRCFIHYNQYFQLDIYCKPCHPR